MKYAYDIIKKPIITERSMMGAQDNIRSGHRGWQQQKAGSEGWAYVKPEVRRWN